MTPVTWESVTEPAFNRLNKEKEFEGTIFKKGKATMKKFKKLFALVVAAALVVAMSISSLAATITVENNDPTADEQTTGESYVAYKIFDAVKAEGTTITTTGTTQEASGAITYQIKKDSKWFSVLFDDTGAAQTGNDWFTAVKIEGSNPETWQVNPTEATTALADAKVIADWLLEKKPSDAETKALTTPAKGEAAASTTVDDGYYLVTSSLGANLGLATTDMPMTVVEKNTYPSLDKKQKDAADGTYADTDVEVGVLDTIYYQLIVFVPATANKDITVVDTPAATLTKPATITVTAKAGESKDSFDATLTEDTDYTFTPGTMTFVVKATDATKGKYVSFEYALTVNADAITKIFSDTEKGDNKNTAVLTYSNYQQTDTVYFKTFAAGFVKVDAADNDKTLAGAEFELTDAQGTVIPVALDNGGYYYPTDGTGVKIVSGEDGTFIIRGLDNLTTYKLKETNPPEGYVLATTPYDVEVSPDNDETYSDVENFIPLTNTAGSVLPSTGGIGTTIFYILGSILVIGAGVLLVTKRRMDA